VTHPAPGHFGAAVRRLAGRRQLGVDALAGLAGVPPPELTAVLGGGAPNGGLVRRLATALRLHPADLFAVADLPVPEDVAPADPSAGWRLALLVQRAMRLSRRQRESLRAAVAALPAAARIGPPLEASSRHRYPPGPGGLLMRLMQNRNAGPVTTAKLLLVTTGQCLAASTYLKIGHGVLTPAPQRSTNFAMVIDIDSDDLAALTGLTVERPPPSAPTDIAGLIWDARRLDAAQLERAGALADRLRA
jgi:hypothetical protein